MKKIILQILTLVYFLVLLVFAGTSIFATYITDGLARTVLEIYVDVILVGGVLLFAVSKKFNYWWQLLVLALIGQIFIWFYPIEKLSFDTVSFAFFLMPAIYMGYKVDRRATKGFSISTLS